MGLQGSDPLHSDGNALPPTRLRSFPFEQPSLFAEPANIRSKPRQNPNPQDHLAAAQGLAKKLRKKRSRAGLRQRTGIAICQHLIALLQESEQAQIRQPS